MEVSGRKKLTASVINASSEEEFLCDPCLRDGQELPAEGFCIDCQHYLCDICFKYHLRALPMRHHALLDKTSMPKSKIPLNDVCKQHEDEPIEFYCQNHSEVACLICKTTVHKQCQAVKYIKELTEDTEFDVEVKKLFEEIDNLQFKFEQRKQWASQTVSISDKCLTKVMEDIKLLQKEIDNFLKEITTKASILKDKEVQSMNAISEICDSNMQELQKKKEDLNILLQLQSKHKLFLHSKKVNKEMLGIQNSLEMATSKKAAERFELEQNTLKDISSRLKVLKILKHHKNPMNVQLKHLKDIEEYNIISYIFPRFTFLPSGQLLVIDTYYSSLSLVNTKFQKVASITSLSSKPYDITTTSDNEVAITFPVEQKIVFVTVSQTLKIKNEIHVMGDCHGIASLEDKLAVTFPGLGVKILKMDGTVLQTISPTFKGQNIFQQCNFIAISPNYKTMYVTTHTDFFSTTLEGELLASQTIIDKILQSKGCDKIEGVCVDNKGTVFISSHYKVSSYTENDLHQIETVCTSGNVVLDICCKGNSLYIFKYGSPCEIMEIHYH